MNVKTDRPTLENLKAFLEVTPGFLSIDTSNYALVCWLQDCVARAPLNELRDWYKNQPRATQERFWFVVVNVEGFETAQSLIQQVFVQDQVNRAFEQSERAFQERYDELERKERAFRASQKKIWRHIQDARERLEMAQFRLRNAEGRAKFWQDKYTTEQGTVKKAAQVLGALQTLNTLVKQSD